AKSSEVSLGNFKVTGSCSAYNNTYIIVTQEDSTLGLLTKVDLQSKAIIWQKPSQYRVTKDVVIDNEENVFVSDGVSYINKFDRNGEVVWRILLIGYNNKKTNSPGSIE